jgi:hypothetical protein
MATANIIKTSNGNVKKIKTSFFSISKILFKPRKTKVEAILPFRVKFTNIGIEGFSTRNPAPIGIAVIGINNYIL